MTLPTILITILAAVVSFGVVVFMYGYKTKLSKQLRWLLGILRFITLFSILLLLINPKFINKTYTTEKPILTVLVDNSGSVKALNQEQKVKDFVSFLTNSKDFQEKFDISFFQFGDDFNELDSLSFSEKNTRITKALRTSSEISTQSSSPIIILSDGNQTLGNDYTYTAKTLKNPVFPVVIGDTTKYSDLRIEQLNTNRYSFLKNKFPIEAILVYAGKNTVNSRFIIKQGAKTVYSENVDFSKKNNVKTISATIPATKVGLQKYSAQLVPIETEKNKTNNYRRFAVEIIDQTTKVLIVSDILHPDLGTLKKAIETNKQRTVFIKKSTEAASILNDYQLVILYQPTGKFLNVFNAIKKLKKNYFIISGKHTQWHFLNQNQTAFLKEVTTQTEEVTPLLTPNFSAFAVEDIGFSNFPPLETGFGELEILVPHEIILEQVIDGYKSNSALFATTELNGVRQAILDGEGIWKWRAQSYLQEESFQSFDDFIGKIVQYLASNKQKSRLEVTNKTFYYSNQPILLSAQYFDKNYVFNNKASLIITVVNKDTNEKKTFPLLLKNNFFQVDLSTLDAGEYSFKVGVKNEAVSRSGTFTILDYNVEQQFLYPDVTKLKQLASYTKGKIYYENQFEELMSQLLTDQRFKSIEKSEEKIVPLIGWKFLLAIIAIILATEWFIRKYNGLI